MPRPVSIIRGKIRCGFLHLLDHVHRVLEADHGEERDRGGDGDREEEPALAAGLEHHHAAEVAVAARHDEEADDDDDERARSSRSA